MNAAVNFERVDWDDPRAVHLRDSMVAELAELYPALSAPVGPGEHRLIDVGPENMVATILALDAVQPIAHAAVRRLDGELEVKRVFVRPEARGSGVAGALMAEVESISRRLGAQRLVLHTGDRQPAAVRLYQRLGYTPIPLYEPYASTMPNSFCFEKVFAAG